MASEEREKDQTARQEDGTLGHEVTDTRLESSAFEAATDPRVPGLTILWHTDTTRVGHRVALTGLAAGRPLALARLEPVFKAPDGEARGPLADSRISRKPFLLVPDGAGLRIERGDSRTSLEIDGEPMDEACVIPMERLESGVVLLLGRRIVLLLHQLDPVLPPNLPDYGLIGDSADMVRLRQDIRRVSDLDVPVLLRGETGTGKELVAQALHRASPRRRRPFVAIDMAAVPRALAASELFGAAKGAFTGADRQRMGHFRRADGGTLFLDEIGEAPQEVQALLLRALETRTIQPVGGETPIAIDVRLISATDLDLEAAVGDERFKAPLLHRLSGFVLRLPPLRRRLDDFGTLWSSFLRRELRTIGEGHRLEDPERPWLAASVVARLARYPWPGNVRQLANAARQLVIANRGEERVSALRPLEDLLGESLAAPAPSKSATDTVTMEWAKSTLASRAPDSSAEVGIPPRPRRPSDIREDVLLEALRRNRFRPRDTAEELGIARGSLYELMEKSPKIRKASELGRAEIEKALADHGGSTEAAAEALEVSAQALRRQMGKLGI